jgi:hypothetical protein
MVLAMHSNTSCLSKPSAQSPVGSLFFCSSNVKDPPDNSAILIISKIIKAFMFSATEAEQGALYINTWEAIRVQLLLNKMGHIQLPIPIQTDNSTADGVVTNNIQPQCIKAMDMRFHWLHCQNAQGQF